VRPERNAAENIRVPERDGMVGMYFIVQELFQPQIKSNEIISKQEVPSKDNISEKERAETGQQEAKQKIFSI
jgi:hypothetical protein